MDKLKELKVKHTNISTSIYKFLKNKMSGFEIIDKYSNSNRNNYSSYLVNKELKLFIILKGDSGNLSLDKKELKFYHLEQYTNSSSYSNDKITYGGSSELPINLPKLQIFMLRIALNKKLSALNRDAKNQQHIDKKEYDINQLEGYLKTNKGLNRDRKLNDLIPDE